MHILICPDKFKGSLRANEVSESIAKGIRSVRPKHEIQCIPLADGGEGTLDLIQRIHGGIYVQVFVNDPLFRPIQADYLWLADQKIAYIEMSRASGLGLLRSSERNPAKTTTFGTGELIKHAIKNGAETIVLTIGGSATNDAGIGMAAALGYSFLSKTGETLSPIGENLIHIHEIKGDKPYPNVTFLVLSDVDNPLHGPNGAAHIFAKQKGATMTLIKQLDKGLINCSKWLDANLPGGGAAGGLGAGAVYFLGASIQPGATWILDKIHFDRAIRKADYVITGEGKIDQQTWSGKLVAAVLARADKQYKQTIFVSGALEDPETMPFIVDPREVFTINERAKSEKDAMENASMYLEKIGAEIALKYL